uniref:OV-16 antigen n=1 Tax=Cacopsylla melanoneura TaxID=428564 RepID=A0A8D9EJU9_9HEMI
MFSKMKVFVSVFLFALVSAEDGGPAKVDEQFRKHNIVPQLISEAPKDVLEIVYPENIKASLGNELTPTQVKSQPQLYWTAEPEVKYTVVMEDPDAANSTGFLHWLVVNIPGSALTSGQVKAEYVGSGPPKGTGLHRYIFYVYKQSGDIEFTEPFTSKSSAGERLHFTSAKFAAKYNMGSPIAGNFYEAQYDDYVPILHSQFKKAPPPPTTVISVPEYITISTPTLKGRSLDLHNESLEQGAATTGASITTEPIPHDGLIKATVVESDSTIHTKLDTAEHSSSGSSEESSITTVPTVPHDGEIKAVYKLNDSVPHIKVLTEEELTHHTTPNLDSTEPSVPNVAHEGIVHVAYIANDSVIHSVSHTEQDLKEFHQHIEDEFKDTKLEENKGDVKDTVHEESKVDEVKVDTKDIKTEETKEDEPHRQDPITPISGEINPVSTESKAETTTEVNSGSTVSTLTHETTTAIEGVSTSTQDSTTKQVSTPNTRPLQVLHHRTAAHEELGHTVPVSIVLVDDSSPPYHHHVGHVNPNSVKSSTESVTTSRTEKEKTTEDSKADVVSTEQPKTNEEVRSTAAAKDVGEDSKSTVEAVASTPVYEIQTSISVLTGGGEKTEVKPAEDVVAYSKDVLKGVY